MVLYPPPTGIGFDLGRGRYRAFPDRPFLAFPQCVDRCSDERLVVDKLLAAVAGPVEMEDRLLL